jgi:5'-nucleotidase
MMATSHLLKDEPPDLILSGVNRGANLGEDVTYSGTVSAAMEGALAGIPSIALSQGYSKEGLGDDVPFSAAEGWAERVLRPLLGRTMDHRTLIIIGSGWGRWSIRPPTRRTWRRLPTATSR